MEGLVLRQARPDSFDLVRLGMFYVLDGVGVGKVKEACKHFIHHPDSAGLDIKTDSAGEPRFNITLI